jgi:ribonuclease E/ribonuclease G
MTDRRMLVESDAAGLRAALVIDRKLAAIEIDRSARPSLVGSVLSVKVGRSIPGLGAIVKLPNGVELLVDSDRDASTGQSGDATIIQVVSDPRGEKLGRASYSIALSGRVAIHLPFEAGVSFSRKLALDTAQRAILEDRFASLPGGWILRRNALSVSDDDFTAEIAALSQEGLRLQDVDACYPAPDAFRRLIVDYGAPPPDSIVVSGRDAERSVRVWYETFAPSLQTRIQRHTDASSLFDAEGLEDGIDALAVPHAPLSNGGSLVIERTEALTAIDVNAGSESNSLSANLVAASEIARQLQLRHIGGIVVIDFISMSRPRDRERVVAALKFALADDPARTYVLPMSAFGLVEMTRERRGPELELNV